MLRKEFPILEKVAYLDNAAGSLKPLRVVKAMSDFYINNPLNPHSTDSRMGMEVFLQISKTRKLVADLINAKPEEVIFNSGTTEGLNQLARMFEESIKPGDEILVSPFNHSSNLIPFLELAKRTGAKIIYSKELVSAINSKTKIVAYAQVNNTIIQNVDVKAIHDAAQVVGALVINDAAQAIAHQEVNLSFADAIVFSSNKLYGPTGSGVLAIKSNLLSKLKPVTFGGGATAEISGDTWVSKDGINKFEAGTPNTAGIIGLGAAIEFFNEIKTEAHKVEEEIAIYAYEKFSSLEGIEIYSKRGESILMFNYKIFSAQDVVSYLGHKNIILRAGQHCAKMSYTACEFLSSIRLSVAFYNTKEEIDLAFEAIKNGGDFLDFI